MFSSASGCNRRSHKLIMVLAVAGLLALAAGAQDSTNNDSAKHDFPKHKEKPYALLFGTMWGVNQHPLPGVTIHIRRVQDKKARWTLVSDNNGEFAQRVPPGKQDYVVWAEIKEKKKPTKTVETKVHVDNEERVDFGLHLTE